MPSLAAEDLGVKDSKKPSSETRLRGEGNGLLLRQERVLYRSPLELTCYRQLLACS